MSRLMIEAEGLHKYFGETKALVGLDLDAREGTILGVLGPNGAGKTTAVRILTTLTHPTRGSARVAGIDVLKHPALARASFGVAGQYAALDELLTGRENLGMVGRLYRLDSSTVRQRADQLLERFELTEAADKPSSTYSGGMRRKLDLAMTLVGNPRIVFLDEPTTGLDPRSRRTMWAIIRDLVADGVTIFLTTQYLEEADQLADRIAVLDQGRLVAQGTPDELKRQLPGTHVRLRFTTVSELDAAAPLFADST
ncbi:MAG TPA: ATP-binding cassette domain-containing protein, partial [Candidatus Limnocylindria bacterium]